MRDLLTYGAPIVAHGDTDREIGIFGVEGSKPGAAAAAVWLSHKVCVPSAYSRWFSASLESGGPSNTFY